jgi:hypothetical protein
MDASDLALVRTSFDSALRDTPAAEIPTVLVKLGWDELWEVEPAVAVAELFEAQGRRMAPTPALDLVVASSLGLHLPEGTAVVHPTLEAWNDPPGAVAGDGTILVDGLVLGGVTRASALLVPTPAEGGRISLAEADTAGLEASEVTGFDEDLRLVRIRGRIATGRRQPPPRSWREVTSVARRALGHELVGLAQSMLDAAGRHVIDRVQFGRPIATFQAVRHRLADLHVAITAARAALDVAGAATDPMAADAAKALAGRAGLLAATHCLQVTGAIGFTWEHELHRRIRRVHLLDGIYGRADTLQGTIGARLLAHRTVPRLGVMGP